MKLRSLELRQFRNYDEFELKTPEELTILVGPNAAGKTNVIEAIQLLTAGRSFRRPQWGDLVEWGRDRASLKIKAEGEQRAAEVGLLVEAGGKHTYTVNGQAKRRLSEVVGIVPSVVFTPEDLDLVKGPAESRRDAIDSLGEQLSATFASLRKDYGRVLRSRNKLLREGAPDREIEPWSHQLVSFGSRLMVHRGRLLLRLGAKLTEKYAELAGGERLELSYDSNTCGVTEETEAERIAEEMQRELHRRAGEERARQVTLVGPHRDDISFEIAGRNARAFASQGQQRTAAISWKLAEVGVIEEVARKKPVLLLDDVMSELDEVRRRALTEVVQRDVQTFVTTTNIEYFEPELLERALVVRLGDRQ